jgi:hypothetical protein
MDVFAPVSSQFAAESLGNKGAQDSLHGFAKRNAQIPSKVRPWGAAGVLLPKLVSGAERRRAERLRNLTAPDAFPVGGGNLLGG